MSSRAAVTAVIAAAGSGERLGAGGPKAFVPLAGRPMVEWSLAALSAAESVGPIVVACPPGATHGLDAALAELTVVDGGATRAASVASALAVVETDLVAIHDAARPLLTPDLVDAVVAALLADSTADGAIAAAPLTDTVKRAAVGESLAVEETVDRASLWGAQTPQVFRVAALREAFAVGSESRDVATDEAMLLEAAGRKVLICPASPGNFKVTTRRDLELAELLLSLNPPIHPSDGPPATERPADGTGRRRIV